MQHLHLFRYLSNLIIIFSGLFFSACASKAPAPLDMSQLPKAAETVLREAIYYSSLFHTCAQLGEEVEIEAATKQQDWEAKNGTLIAAADAAYTEAYTNQSFNYNGKLILPQALLLSQKTQEQVTQELKLSTRTQINQRKTCEFRLAKITEENMSIASIPLVATYQQALLAKTPAVLPEISQIPTLAADIAIDIPPGKSHFDLVNQHETECDNAYTLVIANDWPNEAYANFCGDELTDVLLCEWGKCQNR